MSILGHRNQVVKIPFFKAFSKAKYLVDQGPSRAPIRKYFGSYLGPERIRPIKLRAELALPPQARHVSAWIVRRMNRMLGLQVLSFMEPTIACGSKAHTSWHSSDP